jgi:hypothetical protein
LAICRQLGMLLESIQQTLRAWHTPDARLHLEEHRRRLTEQAAAPDQLMHMAKVPYQVSTKLTVAQPYLALSQLCKLEQSCQFIDEAAVDFLHG